MSAKSVYGSILLLFLLGTAAACRKDKVPEPEPPPEPSKWELIEGNYKVYDSLGAYLYDMQILHIPGEEGQDIDSLRFDNFDGEFNFTIRQPVNSGNPDNYVFIGSIDTLYDGQNKRWKLLFDLEEPYNNVWNNDTIRLAFIKTNINYYISDLVPYYYCNCRQIAVKQ